MLVISRALEACLFVRSSSFGSGFTLVIIEMFQLSLVLQLEARVNFQQRIFEMVMADSICIDARGPYQFKTLTRKAKMLICPCAGIAWS